MPSPTQATSFQLSVTTSNSGTLTGVAAGTLSLVLISKGTTTLRTFTVQDGAGRTYTQAIANDANSGRQVNLFYYENHPGGDVTVTVTASGTTSCEVCFVEVSGIATSSSVGGTGSFDNAVNTNTFYAADTTGFNPEANSFVIAGITTNGTVTTISAGANYTSLLSSASSLSAAFIHEYRVVGASNLTNERPDATTTGTTRQGPGACAWFRVASSGLVIGGLTNGGRVNNSLVNGGLVA